MFGTPMSEKRRLGHFFMALRIDCFEDPAVFKKRLKEMMEALRREPSLDPDRPVLVPGDPEKICFKERSLAGLPVPESLIEQLAALAEQYNVSYDLPRPGAA
jgi:LDH2 family malate/lactate/ureidoglycolate dehydrogenase